VRRKRAFAAAPLDLSADATKQGADPRRDRTAGRRVCERAATPARAGRASHPAVGRGGGRVRRLVRIPTRGRGRRGVARRGARGSRPTGRRRRGHAAAHLPRRELIARTSLRAGRIGFSAPIAGRLSSVVSSADCRSAAFGCGGSIPSLPTDSREPAYARGPSTFGGLYRFFVREALTVV